MKKIILFILMIFIFNHYIKAQTKFQLIAAATSTVSANYTYSPNNGRIGSIHIITSSDFVGTTGTIALQGSNDAINWATVYANDGTTPLSFTLNAASTSYVWQLQTVLFATYRVVYTAGNSSAGTISATILTR